MDTPEPTPSAALPERLVVLMYHGLHRTQDESHFDPRYSVLPAEFERQMRLLALRRDHAWLPGMGAASDSHEAPEVMVSFDDGCASDAEIALPCLSALGLRAAFFVTSGFVDRPGRLARSQLRALARAGMLVGSHGQSHRLLATLDGPALREELQRSRTELEQVLGQAVTTLALPGGRGAAREHAAALDAGYTLVFGSQPGDNRAPRPAIVQRVPVVRHTSLRGFDQLLAWSGPDVRRICWRHRLLQIPKRLVGDQRYDRLRASLLR